MTLEVQNRFRPGDGSPAETRGLAGGASTRREAVGGADKIREEELVGQLGDIHDADARRALILRCLPLVRLVAKRFGDEGVEREDLVGEGILGLLKAVEAYDPGTGIQFRRYVKWWIRQAIRRAGARYRSAIVVPFDVAEKIRVTEAERERAFGETGCWGDAAAGVPEKVADKIRWQDHAETGQRDEAETRDDMRFVRGLLTGMDARKVELLRRRFGLDGVEECSVHELASRFHLPVERIRRIERDILRELAELWR